MAANLLKTTSALPVLLAIMLLPRVVRVVDSQVCATPPYYVVNCNFTSFPRAQVLAIQTPPVKVIQVYGNRISTINSSVDFAGLSGTSYLNLMNNLFVEFPELQALSTSLQSLLLDYNPLTTIDPARLTPLVALRSLTLSFTLLSSFPDVYMPSLVSLILKYSCFTKVPALPILGKRLNSLSLTGNQLQIIDVRALNMYTNLTALFIYNISTLTTFPNFCTLPGNGVAVTVQMSGVPWVCDCRLRWLWYRFPSLSITDGATCSSPPSLAGKLINNVTLSQLTCTGQGQGQQSSKIFIKVMSGFYCSTPPVIARYTVASVIACANKCMSTPDCAHFNIGRRSAGDVNAYYCDVSGQGRAYNYTAAPSSARVSNWEFYVLL